ncbi:O-acetyl-ADP-ribose deacetylase (regulator of RNase III), contains Macro domain [Paenibacillus algorifonticola]|uniref:O-acetyl-ADP-ribose deacetylase (Regulator of RNase III), contains Macro domain n=1 Tax=Paenibacillus algorifonticola TaxID=684063 RepID=A0A1I2FWI3_9BACL|nr:O-acetyl-ADP-ribose deacetylase [Paenibacillus algorifonticola]SFF09179.1 O-acetyl-ADP-ribose deacetylase (regulator of RNase III), contains Macro domain [Paenibacillus algorifonticola]
MRKEYNPTSIELIHGDITKSEVDCIVNAANTSLLGGGGVDGAIHRAGGSEILEQCKQIRARQGGCAVGEAVITTAGKLNSKYVIHTIGPVWNDGKNNEEEKLQSCYINILELACKHNIRSIAFPNISTGIYRFPKIVAAQIALKSVKNYIELHSAIDRIQFVCFDEENYQIYQKMLEESGM